jgi:hypothetical protein
LGHGLPFELVADMPELCLDLRYDWLLHNYCLISQFTLILLLFDRQRRDALALYRGKRRTLWTDEEKEAAKEYYGKVSMKGGDGGI